MKVLLVSPLPPPSGGMATWTSTYAKYASDNGLDARILNSAISVKRAQRKNRSMTILDEFIRSVKLMKGITRYIYQFTPDIIHISSPCTNRGLIRDWLCISLIKNIPVVFHCHCNVEDQANTKVGMFFLNRIVKKVARVIVLNKSSRKVIDEIEQNKSIIIPNYIESPGKHEHIQINDSIHTIVFAGHVNRNKGIDEIVSVADAFPEIVFDILGPVQELPLKQSIPENVHLIGEVSHQEVLSRMAKSDLFLFPSYTEGFSYVMLEAMATGLPIIATNVGANRDMIEEDGGVIVDVRSVDQIKEAIKYLSSSKKRDAISKWNIKKVESTYDIKIVMGHIIKLYQEVRNT